MLEGISKGVNSVLLAGAYAKRDYLGYREPRSCLVSEPIQTLKGCALKAAVGGLFALAVGANPVGCATAAVGYVLIKRVVYFGTSFGKKLEQRFPSTRLPVEMVLGAGACYGTAVLLGSGVLSLPALLAFAVFNRKLSLEIINSIGDLVGQNGLGHGRICQLLLDSVKLGTAAYITCSKITAIAALKMGLSVSLVASMPISLAFGVTMVVTTLVAREAMKSLSATLLAKSEAVKNAKEAARQREAATPIRAQNKCNSLSHQTISTRQAGSSHIDLLYAERDANLGAEFFTLYA